MSDLFDSVVFTPSYISTIKTRLIYIIYINICNELIEETVKPRRLIFGMWKYFGYGNDAQKSPN